MTTLVTFLLDRSGSMSSIRDATIEAFNGYLAELRKGADIRFSLLQFDSISVDTTVKDVAPADAPDLDADLFVPRGTTPLIDACCKTIAAVEKKITNLKGAGEADPKVVVCFQTDGEENCSRKHTWAELNDLIKAKSAEGWQFNFMGAGIDAYQQAARMGLSADHAMSYDSLDLRSSRSAFSARGAGTVLFASGASDEMAISLGEKLAAGDKFDPALQVAATVPKKVDVSLVDEMEI